MHLGVSIPQLPPEVGCTNKGLGGRWVHMPKIKPAAITGICKASAVSDTVFNLCTASHVLLLKLSK
ncbi:conserved hypothetical protein [Roseibium sp. TrichSKD4]|nr:conserved hypothetical protein [Roseibium sp. TrichSKD4]